MAPPTPRTRLRMTRLPCFSILVLALLFLATMISMMVPADDVLWNEELDVPVRVTALALEPQITQTVLDVPLRSLHVYDRDSGDMIVGGHGLTTEAQPVITGYSMWGGMRESPQGQAGFVYDTDTGDVDGDGVDDLVVARYWGQQDHLYLGESVGYKDTPEWTANGSFYSRAVALGDYDNDDDLDLAVATWRNGTRVYENVNGSLSIDPVFNSTESDDSYDIEWADLDSDGFLELIVAGNVGSSDRIYDNVAGNLTNSSVWNTSSFGYSRSISIFDPDDDGDLDIFIADNKGANRMYTNEGGTLDESPTWYSSEWDRSVDCTVADINGDGLDDVAVANNNGPDRVYLNNGSSLETHASWSSRFVGDSAAIDWYWETGGAALIVGSTNGTLAIYKQFDDGALFENHVKVDPPFTVLNRTVTVTINITFYGQPKESFVELDIVELPNIHGYPLEYERFTIDVSGLRGDGPHQLQQTYTWFSGTQVGTHYFVAVLDPDGDWMESDERNNFVQFNITVKAWNVKIHQMENNDFPNVTTYFMVTDQDGRPVYDLTEDLFNVTEEGVDANITDFVPAGENQVPITVVLCIDSSSSMMGEPLSDAKYAAKLFVNHMQVNDSVAVLTFESNVKVVSDFSSNKLQLKRAIDGISDGSSTAMYDGLYYSLDALAGKEGVRAVILLSDGQSNSDSHSLDDALDRAHDLQIPVYNIGLGGGVNDEELKMISDTTGGFYYKAPDPDDLGELYELIAQQLQNLYQITHETPNPNKDGTWREVMITLDFDNATGNDTDVYKADDPPEPEDNIFERPDREREAVGMCWLVILILAIITVVTVAFIVVFFMVRKRIKLNKKIKDEKELKAFEERVREKEQDVLDAITEDEVVSTVEVVKVEHDKDEEGLRAWFLDYPDLPNASKVCLSTIKISIVGVIRGELNKKRRGKKWEKAQYDVDRVLERLYLIHLEGVWEDDREEDDDMVEEKVVKGTKTKSKGRIKGKGKKRSAKAA